MTDKIKSDGGSSDYYKIKLPKSILKDNGDDTVTIEVGDVIRYALNNDFNLGNIFKAMVRWGKKDGIDYEYDRNKIVYFTDDYVAAKKPKVPPEREWIKNTGSMPVPVGTLIECRYRNGQVATSACGVAGGGHHLWSTHWEMQGTSVDIMEWRYVD